MGDWPVKGVLLRPGRIAPDPLPALPWRWIRPDDGWSDDPADPAYNRPVQLPRATSHERLAREDQAYDAIVLLGHNDAPPVPGMGSAIFFHQWVIGADGKPKATEGCVAVAPESMRAICRGWCRAWSCGSADHASSFPRTGIQTGAIARWGRLSEPSHSWIPAFAGMTKGAV